MITTTGPVGGQSGWARVDTRRICKRTKAVTRGNRSHNGPRQKRKSKKEEGGVDPGCIMCRASGREAKVHPGFELGDDQIGILSRPGEERRNVRTCARGRAPVFLTAVCRIRHLGEMEMKRSTVDCSIARNGDRHGRRSNEEGAPLRTLFCRGRLRGETISSRVGARCMC